MIVELFTTYSLKRILFTATDFDDYYALEKPVDDVLFDDDHSQPEGNRKS